MNKYIQQFLDDNDLQAGERFYILDKDYKKMFNKTFYINKNATGTDDILFIITLISVILGILSIGMVCCFITGVSEYLAYLQNPLGATLNYLITGR